MKMETRFRTTPTQSPGDERARIARLRTDQERGADWCNAQAELDLRP